MVISKQESAIVFALMLTSMLGLFTISNKYRAAYSVRIETIQPAVISAPIKKNPVATPIPPTIPKLNLSQVTPDGSHDVYIKTVGENNVISYIKQGQESENILYSLPADKTQELSIPFNAWAPDDKYVFIKTTQNSKTEYWAFKAANRTTDEPIQVVALFNEKFPDYTVVDVTGWAAPNLLIVNTKNAAGETGPSFWFNVANKSITQLSTLFL